MLPRGPRSRLHADFPSTTCSVGCNWCSLSSSCKSWGSMWSWKKKKKPKCNVKLAELRHQLLFAQLLCLTSPCNDTLVVYRQHVYKQTEHTPCLAWWKGFIICSNFNCTHYVKGRNTRAGNLLAQDPECHPTVGNRETGTYIKWPSFLQYDGRILIK